MRYASALFCALGGIVWLLDAAAASQLSGSLWEMAGAPLIGLALLAAAGLLAAYRSSL